jgi:hypothetical protein
MVHTTTSTFYDVTGDVADKWHLTNDSADVIRKLFGKLTSPLEHMSRFYVEQVGENALCDTTCRVNDCASSVN